MRLFTGGARVSDPRDPRSTTPLRQIVGHVAMTATKGSAWYRLAPVPWSFRPDRDRAAHRQEDSHPPHHNAFPGAGVGRAAPQHGRREGQAVRGGAVAVLAGPVGGRATAVPG